MRDDHQVLNILGDDIARVELLDWLGGDLASANGARASYSKRKDVYDDKDVRLLGRLGRDIHHTPLRHSYFQLYVDAPEAVARQWYKHIVGSEYAFKDLPWSEFSQRYSDVPMRFYVPREYRCQSDTNKQASEGVVGNQDAARLEYNRAMAYAADTYQILLDKGVAREQARLVLPLAIYTSWVWTASVQALVHFCALRDHSGAQWEIQQFAKAIRSLVQPLVPDTWAALEASHPLTLQAAHSK